jgi:phospholipid-binding lipoprotein MlaA
VFHAPALREDGLQPREGSGRIRRTAAAFVAALGLAAVAGCATPPSDDPEALAAFEEANDPLEPMNRYFFELNYAADELLLKPLAGWYYIGLPDFAQDGVRNALRNLRSPIVLANDLLQGKTDRAGITVGRFLVNSTLGLGGLFDIASRMDLEYHDEDFGQTLAVHGVDEGPYLMLPLLGPSNPRDAAGKVVDMIFDPLTYLGYYVSGFDGVGTATSLLDGVDTRARNLKTLDEIRRGSLDYYATIRSLYRQRRTDEIHDGQPPPEGIGPGFDFEPEEETAVVASGPRRSTPAPHGASVPASTTVPPPFFIKEPTGPIPAALDP